ncbi:MAG TPA: hypothetical protein VMZ91_05975 [Candidatus Paceibacterota bacterium]|nr:hypothetical protein [Candidatus Paceibacterota bacterium]
MLEEYYNEFGEMHRSIVQERKDPLDVAREYSQKFKEKGINVNSAFLLRYLKIYIDEI